MFTNEYLYPVWWGIRLFFIIFLIHRCKKPQDILFLGFCGALPLSYSISYMTNYSHFLISELSIVVISIQALFVLSQSQHNFYVFMFVANTLGPFTKYTFAVIHGIDLYLDSIPSFVNIVVDVNDINYYDFLFLLYPLPFLGGKTDEKH